MPRFTVWLSEADYETLVRVIVSQGNISAEDLDQQYSIAADLCEQILGIAEPINEQKA